MFIRALAICLTCCSALAQAADQVVVVTSPETGIEQLSSLTLRKLFFAFPVTKNGFALRAVINESDPELEQIFLQNLVATSRRDYERRLLTLTTQSGRARPLRFQSRDRLMDSLRNNPGQVSYLRLEHVQSLVKEGKLTIIAVLWHQN